MPKAEDILSKALQAMKGGKLKWELVGTDSFRSKIGRTFRSVSKDDDENYIFAIYDDDGNLLERSSDTHFGGAFGYGENELYEVARRDALNVDSALQILDDQL